MGVQKKLGEQMELLHKFHLLVYQLMDCLFQKIIIKKLKIIVVPANKWKKDLNLKTKEKLEAVELAEKLSGLNFRTSKNALRDGEAESWLIRHWYITQQNCMEY